MCLFESDLKENIHQTMTEYHFKSAWILSVLKSVRLKYRLVPWKLFHAKTKPNFKFDIKWLSNLRKHSDLWDSDEANLNWLHENWAKGGNVFLKQISAHVLLRREKIKTLTISGLVWLSFMYIRITSSMTF